MIIELGELILEQACQFCHELTQQGTQGQKPFSMHVNLAAPHFYHAELTTLCNYPLDIVKLDRSYINQLTHNDKASTLIRNIARMANELGLTTVAEGVEIKAQLDQLNTWQINEIQGFYFYRPMRKENIICQLQFNADSVLLASEPTP
ncbi:EAL domain-containing protein [Photobacterium sp. TY1-4]|uniref:EAL domain-containing protein n=1 Tax=Photobacterium sp. TY1-4 TaxID=2899122 RepID=UPI0021C10395|nr:EAL domain-containing protein [Photobacterium sp. TY1-4]UXI02434.1 EAL domain-containing protein [Photobacterium sp. TY1-4]